MKNTIRHLTPHIKHSSERVSKMRAATICRGKPSVLFTEASSRRARPVHTSPFLPHASKYPANTPDPRGPAALRIAAQLHTRWPPPRACLARASRSVLVAASSVSSLRGGGGVHRVDEELLDEALLRADVDAEALLQRVEHAWREGGENGRGGAKCRSRAARQAAGGPVSPCRDGRKRVNIFLMLC